MLVAILTLTSTYSLGATLYVSKDGSDGNPGTRSAPLLKIQDAIDASKQNGRIIVGPGKYIENLEIIENGTGEPLTGLRLESSAGRWATIIDGDGNNLPVIFVEASKVQIGRKGKGFTVQNAASTADGLRYVAVAPGGKIEGNWFVDNGMGVFVSMGPGAGKIQIRHNRFSDNESEGLRCSNCDRAVIRENHAQGNETGLRILSSGAATVEKNVSMDNEEYGVHNPMSDGKNRIRNNVFVTSMFNGYNQFDGDGDIVQANISAQNGTGFNSSQATNTHTQQIRNNLSVANSADGFFVGIGLAQKFELNTAVSNVDDGFQTGTGDDFAAFKRNNAMANNCGIEVQGGDNVQHLRQFFANNSAADTCGDGDIDAASTNVDKPNPIKVNTAAKL